MRGRLVLIAAAGLLSAAAAPAPRQPPPEPTTLRPGRNVEAAQTYCRVCHSLDYITTQPPGVAAGFWQAEVTKMVKTFGAPVPDDQAAHIVDYLNAAYRRAGLARLAGREPHGDGAQAGLGRGLPVP